MKSKMAENTKKIFNKAAGYVIWFLIILLALSVVRSIGNRAQIQSEIAAEAAKVAKMKEDNQRLEAQIAQTQGDEFIDREIRNKLGLVKTGEAIVVLPDSDVLKKLAPVTPLDLETLPDPNWKKWEKLFF